MSKLDDLISNLCPDGVPYLQIGEIAVDIFRGAGIKRDEVTDSGIPCVRYGEIYTTYDVWFDSCVSHTQVEYVKSPKYFSYGDILFAITGESVEDIAKSIAYIGNEKCLAGGDIVVLKHNQNPKYLSYALATEEARSQKSKGKVKSKVVHSSVPSIKAITVPIPPLEIQEEIVRILDDFYSLSTELSEQIEAEYAAREKQFAYYKEQLFSFKNVDYVTLNEVMNFRNGKGHEKAIVPNGKYIVVNSKFISTNAAVKKYSEEQISPLYRDDILLVMSDLPNGRALARTFLVNEDDRYTLNQRICAVTVKNKECYLTKFLYYFLDRNPQFLQYDNGVDQTNLKKSDILNIKIPVIPIEEQLRLVALLEKYEGLFVEINATLSEEKIRRLKQYNYYRDQLLTFEKLA